MEENTSSWSVEFDYYKRDTINAHGILHFGRNKGWENIKSCGPGPKQQCLSLFRSLLVVLMSNILYSIGWKLSMYLLTVNVVIIMVRMNYQKQKLEWFTKEGSSFFDHKEHMQSSLYMFYNKRLRSDNHFL